MFLGAGPSEIIVILVIAFIIFGPKRLPEIARTIGKAMGEFKKATQSLQSAVQQDIIEPINNDLIAPVTSAEESSFVVNPQPIEEEIDAEVAQEEAAQQEATVETAEAGHLLTS